MNGLKRTQVSMLLSAIIAFFFSHLHGVVSAARPETANTFYVTKGKNAEVPCWIGRERTGAMWFYTFENLQGRDQTFFKGEFLILRINNVRLTDTGNYMCIKNAERSLVFLVVVDPSAPRVVRAKANEATKMRMSWAAPRSSTEEVAGYKIYTSYTVDGVPKLKNYTINEASRTKKESIVLEDLEPGAEYEIKLSALYRDGPDGEDRLEGPMTPAIRETLPDLPLQDDDQNISALEEPSSLTSSSESAGSGKILISFSKLQPVREPPDTPEPPKPADPQEMVKPSNLLVLPDGDSRLVVSWQLKVSPRPTQLVGFNIAFQAKKIKGKKGHLPASGELNATKPIEETDKGSNWRVVIARLKPNFLYVVTVTPIIKTGFGIPAPPFTVLLEDPQMATNHFSIRAIPVGPDSVLVTFKIQGKERLSKIRLSFMEEGGAEWTRARVKFEASSKVIKGLKPKTTYYFYATTKMAKKKRQVVTHVVMPPSDLTRPTDVTVEVQDSQSVLIRWRHDDAVDVIRYRLTIEEKQPDGFFALNQELSERGLARSCEVNGLRDGGEYRVKVTPFDFNGQGQTSEMVQFRLADDISIATPATKPDFETDIPGSLNISRGDGLEIVCEASGTPTPDVAWYLNADTEPTGTSGVGRSILMIDAVEGPLGAICVANNSAGTVFSPVRVAVVEIPRPKATKPVFETGVPPHLTIAKGGMADIPCVASGTPIPDVTWHVFDAAEPTGAVGAGRNNLTLGPVEEATRVICVAQNSAGIIFAPVHIDVVDNSTDDAFDPLRFTSDLPEVIPVTYKGDVTLNCSAAGSPKPDIRWYKDGVLVAQAGWNELSALFHEIDVTTNFSVRCVVVNDHQLIAAEAKIFAQDPEIIAVEVYAVPLTDSNILVNWIVTQGDLNAISGFNATLYAKDEEKLVEVHLTSSERSLPLDNFVPGTSYKFTLKTLTNEGIADEDIIDIDVQIHEPGNVTNLHVDVVEVREHQVRINLRVTGLGASLVTSYRLSVDQVTPRQNEQILTVDALHSSLVVHELKPHRQYELQVSAMSTDSKPVVNRTVLFTTSTSGRSGVQVLSDLTSKEIEDHEEEDTCPECPPCSSPPVSTCDCTNALNSIRPSAASAATTPAGSSISSTLKPGIKNISFMQDLPNFTPTKDKLRLTQLFKTSSMMTTPKPTDTPSYTPTVTTVDPDVSSLSTFSTSSKLPNLPSTSVITGNAKITSSIAPAIKSTATAATTVEPTTVDERFILTTRLLAASSSGIKIAWIVESGDPDRVGHFMFKLSSNTGRTLIDAKIKSKARTLSLASLRPNSSYTVTITAKDSKGEVLGESYLPLVTQPKDKPADSSIPNLYLEANEIRDDQLRLFWAVQDVGNLKISGFRLQVLDGGQNGSQLLSRFILPNRTNFLLQRLPPNRNLTIIMDALGENKLPFLTSALSFKTPTSGKAGQSVVGSSIAS